MNIKIGMIDSGVGGLTVAKELMDRIPAAQIVYFGDTKNCPYGEKAEKQIKEYMNDIVDFLIKQGIHMLIIACNTATAVVLEELRKTMTIPVFGMIHAGSLMAIQGTKNKKVGIWATSKTIETNIYEDTIHSYDETIEIVNQACPGLVPLIENPLAHAAELSSVIQQYLQPLQEKEVDTLVLGCTHYPIIQKEIQQAAGNQLKLVNPAIKVIEQVKEWMLSKEWAISGHLHSEHVFFVSQGAASFRESAEKLLDRQISIQEEPLEKVLETK